MANVATGLTGDVDLQRLRRLFQLFGATQARGHSPVYEALSEVVADDPALLGLMRDTPADQRRPSLLFAAANRLLVADRESDLAAYYPIHGGQRPVDDRLGVAFARFCERHRSELRQLLAERSTQTSEIRRCLALRLGLARVLTRWPGPLALIEVGASAGLNLLFDHYRYRLGERTIGPAGSPVLISSRILGDAPAAALLGPPPHITRRLGVDQMPIDLADPEARSWLEAFIWPEQVDGLARLRAAIELARASDAVNMVRGDAVTDTARLIAEIPGGEPVVVFTASLLSYLDAGARAAFLAQLDRAARDRPVAWVSPRDRDCWRPWGSASRR